MKKMRILTQSFMFIAIIIVINLIASKLYFRIDFTEDKRYTLSEASTSTMENLDDVITISAYFTEDLPPQLLSTRQDFEDLLIEYENLSDGNIVYEFINPNASEAQEGEAQQKGIRPVIINVTESDQVKQLRAYMGAVLQMGERIEIIPMIQPGSSMEFELTTAVKKLVVIDKPKIGLLQGHGEPSINGIVQLAQQISILYDIEPFTITDTTQIPSYFKALLMIHPQDTIELWEFQHLDRFLQQNGKLFVAFSGVSGDLNQGVILAAPNIGVKSWLASKGVLLGNQVIMDANSASITVQQQQGPFVMNTQVKFPYFPIINDFGDHPASQGLESLLLPLAASVQMIPDSSIISTILATTSENTGLENVPAYIDINKEWTLNDFRDEPQGVAIALEGAIGGAPNAKLVVVNNGSFIVNGEGQQAQQLNADNVNFVSNAVDWLSDDTGLIELRTKGITNRPLKQLEDGERTIVKYANVLGPIILVLLYALIRKQRYKRKKMGWLQGDY